MIKKHPKIAAFTIMDLMTGMVITSIVVGMVFYSFAGLNKQITSYTLTRSEITVYRLMKQDLERQFDHPYNTILSLPNGFSVENDSTKINYVVEGTRFIRQNGFMTDTLSETFVDMKVVNYTNRKGETTPFVASVAIQFLLANQETTCLFSRKKNQTDDFNKQLIDGV